MAANALGLILSSVDTLMPPAQGPTLPSRGWARFCEGKSLLSGLGTEVGESP